MTGEHYRAGGATLGVHQRAGVATNNPHLGRAPADSGPAGIRLMSANDHPGMDCAEGPVAQLAPAEFPPTWLRCLASAAVSALRHERQIAVKHLQFLRPPRPALFLSHSHVGRGGKQSSAECPASSSKEPLWDYSSRLTAPTRRFGGFVHRSSFSDEPTMYERTINDRGR